MSKINRNALELLSLIFRLTHSCRCKNLQRGWSAWGENPGSAIVWDPGQPVWGALGFARWWRSFLELVGDGAEVEDAGFAVEPFGGADGTAGEAAAGVCIVAQDEGVDLACGRDDVFAFGVGNALAGDGDLGRGLLLEDDLPEGERGAGGCVELGDVVDLVHGEAVAVELGEGRSKAEELLHADREVGAVEQGAVVGVQALERVEVGVPAGGADDDAAAGTEHGRDVFDGSLGGCEVDDGIDRGEALGGECGGVLVFCNVE